MVWYIYFGFQVAKKAFVVVVLMKGQLAEWRSTQTETVFSIVVKGQLILKCPFGVFKSPKKPTKFFPGFLEKFFFAKQPLMFSTKATKIDEIFTVDLTLCSKCQIDGEDLHKLQKTRE